MKEKIIKSFADLGTILQMDKLEKTKKEETPKQDSKIQKEQVLKIKPVEIIEQKEKPLYDAKNIRMKGSQLITSDGFYETYSKGNYTSWKTTMIGLKNGNTDLGTNIEDGYYHGSFHNRARAAEILIEIINKYKK